MIIHISNISIQRFTAEHTDPLYELINQPEVRKGMSNSAAIPYEKHLQWVKENLLEGNRVHLFMLADQCYGLGAVLLKNIDDKSGEIGIMVSKNVAARMNSLTGKLLTGILFYAFQQLDLQYVHMRILPHNKSSIATAQKIGAEFQSEDETYQNFRLEKSKHDSYPFNQSLIQRYHPY
jgi:RimJ/RimL family protein N-acetyltransferase